MQVTSIKTRIFEEGEGLTSFVIAHIPSLHEHSLLAVTSKIVALSEGRTAIIENEHTKEDLIQKESEWSLFTKYCWLTIKDGMVMPSAGIDASNGNGKLILLPKDSFASASLLRDKLCNHYRIKNLGIVITDSRSIPLRSGITGIALGYAGFKGLRDYRGDQDIFGNNLKVSITNIADSIASSAVLVMGEGNEQSPLSLLTEVPVEFCDTVNRAELQIDLENDMYRPFYEQYPSRN